MKKSYLPVSLMIAAIIGISSFQVFWLRQTYLQEKKNLSIKTDFAFRNAIQELQVKKLKLDNIPGDTTGRKIKMLSNDSVSQRMMIRVDDKAGMVSSINIIRKKLGSSISTDSLLKSGVIISGNHNFEKRFDAREMMDNPDGQLPARDQVFRLLYGVDSLQDSLKIVEISEGLNRHLKKQNIQIPYQIERTEGKALPGTKNYPEVTIGFAHPITYRLVQGNTIPYLLRQISLPIIFSVLLMAITILSFLLLYRNLLRQRKLTQLKNEFIANITHELKTPIATVSVAIEAIKNFNTRQDPERTGEYLGIAGLELNRLSMLVDKVLRLSMFENKEVDIKVEHFDFKELLQDVLKTMNLQFEKVNASVNTEWQGNDFMMQADKLHISSVLYNLFDNAIRYSKGNLVVDIQTLSEVNAITCRIADNGMGIDPQYKDKIFDKFFRVPQGNVHNVKGYGLGLSYASHILQQHKGSIECKSDGKNGTEFIITIPRNYGG